MVTTVSVKSMIRNILNYLKWSDIAITFIVNPCSWKIEYEYSKPDSLNPKMHAISIKFLMLRLLVIIDDGSW